MQYSPILTTSESTVMMEYFPINRANIEHQTEEQLENNMIKQLTCQGYEFVDIKESKQLEENLRNCLEELNNFKFTDNEWKVFFNSYIANKGEGIKEKTNKIQKDYIQTITRNDGSIKNIYLIDKKNIHNNKLQVINQYTTEGNYKNRYDVTILVNGLPLVHIELKRRGVALKEAFNQIDRYQRDSFWANSGLYEFVQIFVISNGTHTKYYSNSTRFNVVEESNGKRKARKEGSSSFEFTSYWADAKNKTIEDIVDFTSTFFSKHTILSILTRYCVFTEDEKLLVMRPYQIAAVEAILSKIKIDVMNNKWGNIESGGYVWHTTGSGKTLTSFKASQIISELPEVDKVLFVVDRQDLDYQTMKEYDRFEKGCANANKSTKELEKQLNDDNCHIIITTIQKLGIFCKNNVGHSVYAKKVVMIFDECHRSQFGEQHNIITKKFKKYALFGFTGTPIFAQNTIKDANNKASTTEQIFGKRLHTYTIVNAIGDKNVLPFKIDYVNTVKDNKGDGTLVEAIDEDSILLAPERISNIVDYIITHFNQKTFKSKSYTFNRVTNIENIVKDKNKGLIREERSLVKKNGFNSILAVANINAAKMYYEEFKKHDHNLKVALIYSYGVNEDSQDGFIVDEDSDSTEVLDVNDRVFLDGAISDYNLMFGTQYDTSSSLFPNYYKDLSWRMKQGDIDVLIVVNMFLTGFDATTLNTLWIDKNVKMHSLIQAFSRTNRILNSIKVYGNIVCFRNLKKEVDDAIALFGNENAKGIVILRAFNDYYYGYDEINGEDIKHIRGYIDLVNKLHKEYPLSTQMLRDDTKKAFIKLFGSILRLQNILRSFDEFEGKDIFLDIDDYLSIYNDLYEEFKRIKEEDDVSSDVVFEMELVRQIVVNIDYILDLIEKYCKKNTKNKEIPVEINRAIMSNPELRPKKELIEEFISSLIYEGNDIADYWIKFKNKKKEEELSLIISEGIGGKPLKDKETRDLVDKIFRNGLDFLSSNIITNILPVISRKQANLRRNAKIEIFEKLRDFYLKYYD